MSTIILKSSSSVLRVLVIPLCYIVMLLLRLDTYLYRGEGSLATRLDFYNTYTVIYFSFALIKCRKILHIAGTAAGYTVIHLQGV